MHKDTLSSLDKYQVETIQRPLPLNTSLHTNQEQGRMAGVSIKPWKLSHLSFTYILRGRSSRTAKMSVHYNVVI